MSSVFISSSPYYLSFAAGGRANACYSPPSPPPPSAAVAASLDLPILEEPPSTTTPLILSSSASSSSSAAVAASPPASPTPAASLPIAIPVALKPTNDVLNNSKVDTGEGEKGGESGSGPTAGKPQLQHAHGSSLSYDVGTVEKEKDSHIIDALAATPSPVPSSVSSSPALSSLSSASSHSSATVSASSFPSQVSVGQYGQDAWFVHSRAGSSLHAFGVADGVGGWRSQGVDSGIIARTMMRKCCEQVDSSRDLIAHSVAAAAAAAPAASAPTLPFSLPSLLLSRAYQAIKVEGKVTAGSTTACVLTVTPCRCLSQHSHALPEKERRRRSTSSTREDGVDNGMLLTPPPSPSPKDEEDARDEAAHEDGRHELSTEDEAKEDERGKETQPAVQGVDLPLGGSMTDSDDSDDEQRPDDVSFTSHIARAAVTASSSPPSIVSTVSSPSVSSSPSPPSSSPTSHSYKTASAFWSAVEHVISSSPLSSSRSPAAAAPTTALFPASLPAGFTSPPPSRPPSPSSPPLFLSCASLGDSGFLLLRHLRVIHRSDIQRSGRIVKQLAVIPPHLRAPIHRYCDDPPSDATLSSHRLEDGDLIIVGSDGLLDNLCSSWTVGGGSGFFVPWGRFLLGGGLGDRDDDSGDREVIEKQNRKVEGIVKESIIDWEGRQEAQAAAAGQAGVGMDTTATGSSSSTSSSGREELVRLICDRLVQEATDFMHSMEGKPDDLTVLVLMVGKTAVARMPTAIPAPRTLYAEDHSHERCAVVNSQP